MRSAFGFLWSTFVVALALTSLGISLSGLMSMEPPGGMLRTLGGLLGFVLVFGLTLLAAARSS
jgi:hypothetical protein